MDATDGEEEFDEIDKTVALTAINFAVGDAIFAILTIPQRTSQDRRKTNLPRNS